MSKLGIKTNGVHVAARVAKPAPELRGKRAQRPGEWLVELLAEDGRTVLEAIPFRAASWEEARELFVLHARSAPKSTHARIRCTRKGTR